MGKTKKIKERVSGIELTLNEKIIRFMGSACTDKDYQKGEDVTLTINGNVIEITERDNQDGTFNRTFKVKLITVDEKERTTE